MVSALTTALIALGTMIVGGLAVFALMIGSITAAYHWRRWRCSTSDDDGDDPGECAALVCQQSAEYALTTSDGAVDEEPICQGHAQMCERMIPLASGGQVQVTIEPLDVEGPIAPQASG